MDEFEIISRYFATATSPRPDVVIGIGDDAAVLETRAGHQLVVTTDMLAEGIHFPTATEPDAVGHKALAVNLSDLAAMGAEPAWATLSIALPAVDPDWLEGFVDGFARLALEHGVALIGGDTVRGPLTISVQLIGWVPRGRALRRDGARVGDDIFVSGALGDAALALVAADKRMDIAASDVDHVRRALDRPTPRVREGIALRELASAAIDISDGLTADLGHILTASGAGATVSLPRVPVSEVYARARDAGLGWGPAVCGGDDYELCFTAAPERSAGVHAAMRVLGTPVTRVGTIEGAPGLRIVDSEGKRVDFDAAGYDHFRRSRR